MTLENVVRLAAKKAGLCASCIEKAISEIPHGDRAIQCDPAAVDAVSVAFFSPASKLYQC